MRLGKLGLQVMVKSAEAFGRLQFLGYESVSKSLYYSKYKERGGNARSSYKELRKQSKSSGLIITEIIKNPQLLKDFEQTQKYDVNYSR